MSGDLGSSLDQLDNLHFDVGIVGAGPVGLALAGDLAWRGIRSVVLERGDGSILQPKMDMVGIRTMEFCRRWGIVEWVRDSPYPRDYRQDNVYVTSVAGYELGREPVPSMEASQPPPQSPQQRERCPQDMFDPILRRFVSGFAEATLLHNTRFDAFRTGSDHLRLDVADIRTGGTARLSCTFLVGCDGAGSTVRQQAGLTMGGERALTYTTNVIFRCPAFTELHDKGLAYRFIVIDESGTWATIVAINGADRWRFSIIGDSTVRTYDEAQIRREIERAVGVSFDFEIESVVPWVRSELVADSYQAGQVFIAGDAAHVMSPTGGFGMNTGIGDAIDLSWKLAAVIRGWGGPNLLSSYTAERRPVALRNVREASANLRRMLSPRDDLRPSPKFLEPSSEGELERRALGEAFSARMKHEWHTLGIHLGYRYDESPVIVPDGSPTPVDERMTYTQLNRPGARAPHVWLPDGRSTLDLFGHGFVLLVVGAPAARTDWNLAATPASKAPIDVVELDSPEVVAAYGVGLVLVRPDGHVAWRADAPVGEAEFARAVAVVSGW